MRITGAHYGAVATLAGDGSIDEFLNRGRAGQPSALSDPPEAKGLLGLVLTDRRPVRLDHIAERGDLPHPEAGMDAFLGVPLLHRSRVSGALYLCKEPGADPSVRTRR